MNIAREVLVLQPSAEVIVHTRQASPGEFLDPRVRVVVDEGTPATSWNGVLASVRPAVAIYDTMLPNLDEPVTRGTRCALVLRARRAEAHDSLDGHPFLDRVDLVIVPHTEAEFGRTLPGSIADRSVFVGPIVRAPDPTVHDRLRDDYDLHGAFTVVSTAGGGGFAETAVPFYAAAVCAHRALAGADLGRQLRHILVLGPNADPGHVVAPRPGLTVVRSDPRLIDLMAIADLVISEAGYNTAQELRRVGTPAVLVPGTRRLDDQHERAAAMETIGIAVAVPAEPAQGVADAVLALALDPHTRSAMRTAAQARPFVTGNRPAAAALVALARQSA
jgi:Glycosyltransferase family 28 C-terminal domain